MIRLLPLLLLALPAQAEDVQRCLPRDEMAGILKSHFGEISQGQFLVANENGVLEMFGADRGTWTLLAVNRDGLACIVATGELWIMTGVRQGA